MKNLLAVITCFLILIPLYADSYPSNSIAQITDKEDSPYRLEVNGNTSVLTLNGKTVRTIIVEKTGNTRLERYIEADGTESESLYSDSLLKEIHENGETTVFHYIDGRLNMMVTSDLEGKILSTTWFYREASSGRLLGTRKIEGGSGDITQLVTKNDGSVILLEGNDGVYTLVGSYPGNIIVTETKSDESYDFPNLIVERDEEGNLLVTQNDILRVYDKSGRLKKEGRTEYSYDNHGRLKESLDKDENGTILSVSEYDGQFVTIRTDYTDGIIRKKTIWNDDGTFREILYENGYSYAEVTYSADGRNVTDVSYY